MRARRAVYNSVIGFIYEAVAIVAGFILPRLILSRFGSDYNGVAASISQFIGYISLTTLGMTTVTTFALYKPLAEKDTLKISGIVRASEIFMRRIALIFAGALVLFAALYPFLVITTFDWVFTFSLIIILSVGTFATYFFGTAYSCVLAADQRGFISTLVRICTTIVNVAVSVILILAGFEYRVVMLASSIVFLANPIFTYGYVRKRYRIIRSVKPDNSALKQRWDAFAHKFAGFVSSNTDIVLLTIFVGVREVSVYSVYHMVVRHISSFIHSAIGSGFGAPFGDMISRGEHESLRKTFRLYEFLNITIFGLVYTCAAILIVPFVSVYTRGIQDADYHRPLFAYLMCAMLYFTAIRAPYNSLVFAAGHFKQTRNGEIAGTVIKVILSVVLVHFLGLVGLAIGGMCATLLRTVQLAIYALRNIVKNPFKTTMLRVLTSMVSSGLVIGIVQFLPKVTDISYIAWTIHALTVFGVAVVITLLVTLIFHRNEMFEVFMRIKTTVGGMGKKPTSRD